MKVLQINSTYRKGGSTGRIVADLKQVMEQADIDGFAAYGVGDEIGEKNTLLFQQKSERFFSQFQSRLFARHGFYNVAATKRLLQFMDEIKPDIVHLHNIHGYYVHCGLLFEYIKKNRLPIIWTLHDCWSFTGWCAYFDYSQCTKWETMCSNCPSKNDYPVTWISARARLNFEKKKETFCGVENMVLITPSKWLSLLTRESFLREYPVKVINNGVDTNIFKPIANSVKKELGIEGKKMMLAVAGGLAKRKGRDYLLRIPYVLNPDEVLVVLGIKDEQKGCLPKERCIGLPYTNDVEKLAEIYSAADVFINTTLEDNFPTTNIEALACGTPIVTFDTGGSVEPVLDEENVITEEGIKKTRVGRVVCKGDLVSLMKATRELLFLGKTALGKECVDKAERLYNKQKQYEIYVDLYKQYGLDKERK